VVLEPHLKAVLAFEVRHIQLAARRNDALMNLVDHALFAAAETEEMRDMDLFRQGEFSSSI